jgi:hypothetical protein
MATAKQAFQWNPDAPASTLPLWFTSRGCWDIIDGGLVINDMGKITRVTPGEWIVREPNGRLWATSDYQP